MGWLWLEPRRDGGQLRRHHDGLDQSRASQGACFQRGISEVRAKVCPKFSAPNFRRGRDQTPPLYLLAIESSDQEPSCNGWTRGRKKQRVALLSAFLHLLLGERRQREELGGLTGWKAGTSVPPQGRTTGPWTEHSSSAGAGRGPGLCDQVSWSSWEGRGVVPLDAGLSASKLRKSQAKWNDWSPEA